MTKVKYWIFYTYFICFSFEGRCDVHAYLLQDLLEAVSALSLLIKEVQEDIRLSKDVWNRVFVR